MIRETGAELIRAGKTFEEPSRVVEELSEKRGLYYVHSAIEPHLINVVGTEFLEIIENVPDLDAVILPIGAGSEVAAAVTVFKQWRFSSADVTLLPKRSGLPLSAPGRNVYCQISYKIIRIEYFDIFFKIVVVFRLK